ncbi:hypothetical protein WJX84_009508 [Apatococcus fuscideae]|uniref:Mitochondrial carrier protein n=1 Tax=Apatococcus fuscideae TaxID=2026836 RepID=A0AAW1T8D5_9CHLO
MTSTTAMPQKPPRRSPLGILLSGLVSGAVVSVTLQPFDVVRTRMQGDAANRIMQGSLRTCRTIIAEAGPRGLWRGTSPTMVRLSLGLALNFLVLENVKSALLEHRKAQRSETSPDGSSKLTAVEAFITGGTSRAIAAAALCPVTVVKTRMEYSVGPQLYQGTFQALKHIARTERLKGLFRGLGPTVLTNAPFSALYYLFFTRLKDRLAQAGPPSPAANFAAGAVAAVAATFLTQPTDVLRTRLQLTSSAGPQTLGSFATIAAIFRGQGVRGLWAGTVPRVMKRSLQTAMVLSYIRPQLINSSLRQTADYQLKQAISRFIDENPTGSTLTLITSDADFTPDLVKAQALGYHVNLLCDQLRSKPRLKEASHWHHDWSRFLESEFPQWQPRKQGRKNHHASPPSPRRTASPSISATSIPAIRSPATSSPEGTKEVLARDGAWQLVSGYPASMPAEHMLLHACASAVLSGPLRCIWPVPHHPAGPSALVQFRKKTSGRIFRQQQRMLPIGLCTPCVILKQHYIGSMQKLGRMSMQQPVQNTPGHVILAVHGHPRGSSFQDAEKSATYLCKSLPGVHFAIGTLWRRRNFIAPVAFISLTEAGAKQFATRHLSPLRIPSPVGEEDLELEWEAVTWAQARDWMLVAGPKSSPEEDL